MVFLLLTFKQLKSRSKKTRSNHRNIDRRLSRMNLLISLGKSFASNTVAVSHIISLQCRVYEKSAGFSIEHKMKSL